MVAAPPIWARAPDETATSDAETRPREKYAKLSYAGRRTESGRVATLGSFTGCMHDLRSRPRGTKPQVNN